MKKFDLESQFATPEEYYKAQLVLRKVNENLDLTSLSPELSAFPEMVTFCNKNKLNIQGVEIKKNISNGGEIIPDEEMAKRIKEIIGAECNGKIYWYTNDNTESEHEMDAYYISDKTVPTGSRNISGKEFDMITAGLECHWMALAAERNSTGETNLYIPDLEELVLVLQPTTIMNYLWEDVEFITGNEKDNGWVLNHEKVKHYEEQGLDLDPVLTVTPETLKMLDGVEPAIYSEFKSFSFSLNSYMLYCVNEAIDPEIILPKGICVNCNSSTIVSGDLISCYDCMCDIILFFDDHFPYTDSMFEPLREFSQLLWKSDFND